MPDTKKTIMEEIKLIVDENVRLKKLFAEYKGISVEQLEEELAEQTLPEDDIDIGLDEVPEPVLDDEHNYDGE